MDYKISKKKKVPGRKKLRYTSEYNNVNFRLK